nr:hypothetical protein [uncultured Flavonifractor sp.]
MADMLPEQEQALAGQPVLAWDPAKRAHFCAWCTGMEESGQ